MILIIEDLLYRLPAGGDFGNLAPDLRFVEYLLLVSSLKLRHLISLSSTFPASKILLKIVNQCPIYLLVWNELFSYYYVGSNFRAIIIYSSTGHHLNFFCPLYICVLNGQGSYKISNTQHEPNINNNLPTHLHKRHTCYTEHFCVISIYNWKCLKNS